MRVYSYVYWVLQCVAVHCSALQCIVVRSQEDERIQARTEGVAVWRIVLRWIAVCCCVLQYGLEMIWG